MNMKHRQASDCLGPDQLNPDNPFGFSAVCVSIAALSLNGWVAGPLHNLLLVVSSDMLEEALG